MQEIADALEGTDIPVLVKNPVNPDLDLWIGALERLNRAGIRRLGVIHRGFSTSAPIPYRNDPGWRIAIELRTRYPQMAFFADPSHMAGDRKYLLELSQRAMDLGLDGLMVESHCDPSCAWSDAKQQLTPRDLQTLLESLVIREKTSDNEAYKEGIDTLRARIDVLDENLLKLLAERMNISNSIGQYKKDHNVAILQATRWEQVLSDMIAKGKALNLSEESVSAIFNAIHDESVRVQNEVLKG
jgi:chorismate mutase